MYLGRGLAPEKETISIKLIKMTGIGIDLTIARIKEVIENILMKALNYTFPI